MADKNSGEKRELTRNGIKEIVRTILRQFIHLAILLVSANKILWVNAWVYFGLILGASILYALIMIRVNPQVLNERGKGIKPGTKRFDKIFFAVWIPVTFATFIIAGLDAQRYGWSSMHWGFGVAGIVIMMPAILFQLWALMVNPHFEGTVRIQDDRDHQVCDSGPYGIIRHPGYAGLIPFTFCIPFILGSWWALVPAAAIVVLFIIRTALEDKTLNKELPGYEEYAKRVRFRLVPGIW